MHNEQVELNPAEYSVFNSFLRNPFGLLVLRKLSVRLAGAGRQQCGSTRAYQFNTVQSTATNVIGDSAIPCQARLGTRTRRAISAGLN